MPETEKTVNVIIQQAPSNGMGIATFIFGFMSIFILTPLFAPIAIVTGIIGIIKKQYLWSIVGLICTFFGMMTSPIFLGILGIAAVAANV